MLRKLHAETMEWTFMHPRDEALNRLVREELKPAKTLLQFLSGLIGMRWIQSNKKPSSPKIGRDGHLNGTI